MLEITCQDATVSLVPIDDLYVIRIRDASGIVVNVALTPAVLTALVEGIELPAVAA